MQLCIVVMQILVIFWYKKNSIFTLKNEILKHTDFASEWKKSHFQGLKIFKIFRERMPLDPPTGGPLKAAPFHRTPSTKKPGSAPDFLLTFFLLSPSPAPMLSKT